jgi:integrase
MSDETTTISVPESATSEPDTPTGRKRAIRGFGYVYRRGRVWWVRYSHRGRDHRESAGSERETDAWRLLKERWKAIGRGRFVFGEDRVTMGASSRRWNWTTRTTAAALFERVAWHLPEDLADVARFGYHSGWRKGEVQRLTWPDVDRAAGRIVLRREHSKNGEPRVLPLVGELAALIERRWVAREHRTPDGTTALSPFVFHRDGRPVGDFRKAWATACTAAGVAGTLFHDLRRSAVRNLDRAGVSQSVAMALSGHKTASIYRRYRIVAEDDLREALLRLQASVSDSPGGTVTPLREAASRRS